VAGLRSAPSPPDGLRSRPLRFLADLNISPLTVEALRRRGWDVVRTSPLLSPKATDQEILTYARDTGWVLLTQDLDFSSLLALSGMDQPSLITLRLATAEPDVVTARLLESEALLSEALQEGCAVTIEDSMVRVRKLPIRTDRS